MTLTGTLTVLHAFTGGTADGAFPNSALIQGTDGIFFGTTASGGSAGTGTVFTITLQRRCHHPALVRLLHGRESHASLIQGTDGNFYGTTDIRLLVVFWHGLQDDTRWHADHPVRFHRRDDRRGVADAGLIEATDGNFYGTTSTAVPH